MLPILYIVIPCYNEEKVLPTTSKMFLEKLYGLIGENKIAGDSRILFVDDGSRDGTWDVISGLARDDRHFCGVSLSRNRGHQNALLCGLMEAKDRCDISVSIDCDGQDDINAIDEMIAAYMDGSDIVYGIRRQRKTDTAFKRATAQGFYKLMNVMGTEVVYNHADFRLLSKRVLRELSEFKEVNIFLRGMIPLVGFKSTSVYYDRNKRVSGESHYPLSKMIALAFDGITSLSVRPIRIITALGFVIALISFIGVAWSVIRAICGATVTGWASIVSIVCFVSGIQLISIGVIGEYIGKIYMEVKGRPRYIVSERTED